MTNPKPSPGKVGNPVYMKCSNPKCDSIQVVEIAYTEGTRLYRCVKCKLHRPVQVGGKMDIRQL
jgi:hypothetical protein